MGGFIRIFTVMAILIGIYLFLSKGQSTVEILKVVSDNSIKGIKALQGRSI